MLYQLIAAPLIVFIAFAGWVLVQRLFLHMSPQGRDTCEEADGAAHHCGHCLMANTCGQVKSESD